MFGTTGMLSVAVTLRATVILSVAETLNAQ